MHLLQTSELGANRIRDRASGIRNMKIYCVYATEAGISFQEFSACITSWLGFAILVSQTRQHTEREREARFQIKCLYLYEYELWFMRSSFMLPFFAISSPLLVASHFLRLALPNYARLERKANWTGGKKRKSMRSNTSMELSIEMREMRGKLSQFDLPDACVAPFDFSTFRLFWL